MSKEFIYFTPAVDIINKRKHILFLQKAGFFITKVKDITELIEQIKVQHPSGIIISEEDSIDRIVEVTDLPIITILKDTSNVPDLISKYSKLKNMIFLRFENDSLNTIAETANLVNSISGN